MLQLLKVGTFPLYVNQLFLQPTLHRRARLQAIPSQPQEPSDLAEFESQTLYAADKNQRLDVVFGVPAEASLRPGRPRQQGVALVKADRVNAEPNLFCHDADLHYLGSSVEATPWSIVQSQARFLEFGRVLSISSSTPPPEQFKNEQHVARIRALRERLASISDS